ncbi:MAG: hypothetical protein IPJ06_04670 [Saprospiraceae bacterium]|nr:hypothetical protein [Saprospiraceae bacterium]
MPVVLVACAPPTEDKLSEIRKMSCIFVHGEEYLLPSLDSARTIVYLAAYPPTGIGTNYPDSRRHFTVFSATQTSARSTSWSDRRPMILYDHLLTRKGSLSGPFLPLQVLIFWISCWRRQRAVPLSY